MLQRLPTALAAASLAIFAWTAAARAEIDLAATKAGAALIEAGRKAAVAGDCVACHTAAGGKPYAGGLAMQTPFGTIYSTNITPDTTTGIGRYTYEEFAAALRKGVAKDGHHLYPAMPYPSYARVSEADMRALYAYFMEGVDAIDQPNRGTEIPWPLSMRWPLAVWNKMFVPAIQPASAEAERGAYLVEGLGHCGSCHTPRGIGFQEKAMTDSDGPAFLAGGEIDGWFAKSLRGEKGPGLGDWSADELVDFMRTGRTDRTAAFGGMTEVVTHSTQSMDSADLQAIARYLKSLTPSGQAIYTAKAGDSAFEELRRGDYQRRGAVLYAEFCQACHRSDGMGVPRIYPALAGNSAVLPANPASLIRVALAGGRMAVVEGGHIPFAMPGFSALSDQDVADILTFVRAAWGNNAPPVEAAQVGRARKAFPILPARP